MEAIKENTVSAKGQLVNSDSLRFYGDENAKIKILIVLTDNKALFGSRDKNRISVSAVHRLVS